MSKFSEIINSSTPVLVDFKAEWCGPCKMMTPILSEVKEELGDNIRIIKIDVDKNPAIASQYNVKGVPTLMIFREGNMLWRQAGLIQTAGLLSIIQQYS